MSRDIDSKTFSGKQLKLDPGYDNNISKKGKWFSNKVVLKLSE